MSHQYKCIAATNNNIGWGWIELTLCSSWKLPCMPIVYNPVLVPRCCPVFCCMKVIRLFGPPSLVQDNNCTPCTLIFLTRWLWVIKIKKAFDPLCTYIVVCCDQVNRAGNTDHAVTVCKGFVYSIVNSIYKQDCMIIKHDRHIFGEIHKVLVGFFLSWLCFRLLISWAGTLQSHGRHWSALFHTSYSSESTLYIIRIIQVH